MSPKIEPKLVLNTQVVQGVSHIGDRWAMLVIRDIYLRIRRFEFLLPSTGAARATLAARLKSLISKDILFRQPYQTRPRRYEYRLTPNGLALYPSILAIWKWETDWCTGTGSPSKRYQTMEVPPRFQRRTKTHHEYKEVSRPENFHFLDIVGDRWSALVLAAVNFCIHRYDDIAGTIGISTNILAIKLKLLVAGGILECRPNKDKPSRFEYHATQKRHDLYAFAVTAHAWTDEWLMEKGRKPLWLTHRPCGKQLRAAAICSECDVESVPKEVTIQRQGSPDFPAVE